MLRLVTMDVIGLTAFGHDFGCVRNAASGITEEMRAFEFLLDEHTRRLSSVSPLDTFYAFPTAANLKHRQCNRVIRNRINGIIAQRRKLLEENAQIEMPEDFLAHMLIARDDSGVGLTDSELSDELVTLMFAGGCSVHTPSLFRIRYHVSGSFLCNPHSCNQP
jgi:cytochrome P450